MAARDVAAQHAAEAPFVLAIDVGTTSVRAELFDRLAHEATKLHAIGVLSDRLKKEPTTS